MKYNKNFISNMDGKTQMLVDTSAKFSGLVRNNETAAFIIDMVKKGSTEEEIVKVMFDKYDADEATIRKDVKTTIEKHIKVGALIK